MQIFNIHVNHSENVIYNYLTSIELVSTSESQVEKLVFISRYFVLLYLRGLGSWTTCIVSCGVSDQLTQKQDCLLFVDVSSVS